LFKMGKLYRSGCVISSLYTSMIPYHWYSMVAEDGLFEEWVDVVVTCGGDKFNYNGNLGRYNRFGEGVTRNVMILSCDLGGWVGVAAGFVL